MIEKVEDFCAKLKINRFRKMSVLHQRGVDVVITWAFENISAGISKRASNWKYEGRGIEPMIGSAIAGSRIANHTRSIVGAEAENRSAGAAVINVGQQRYSEWPAALKGNDP